MKKSQKFYYKKKSLAYIACEWRVLITKDLIDASIEWQSLRYRIIKIKIKWEIIILKK